jgi:NDP-sugar pyrophosphorylase family protein
MAALVLAAGLGTRLHPLTLVRAKPAIPVAGQPMIRRIARWLAGHGVTDLVVNLHHLPGTITAALGDGSDLGAAVRYSWEQPRVLGSAGCARQAGPILGAETFFIVNGDTLTDMDLKPLAHAHEHSDALVTLALVPNTHPERYGGVRLDEAGRVLGFARRGASAGTFHFIGVQMASADAFRSVPPGVPVNSIGGVYDELIASRPGAIRGLVCDAQFWDVGTPWDYWTTSNAFGPASEVGSPAGVTRSILWDNVTIGAGATLDECIVADGVSVPAGAVYRRTVLVRSPETGDLLTSALRDTRGA